MNRVASFLILLNCCLMLTLANGCSNNCPDSLEKDARSLASKIQQALQGTPESVKAASTECSSFIEKNKKYDQCVVKGDKKEEKFKIKDVEQSCSMLDQAIKLLPQ